MPKISKATVIFHRLENISQHINTPSDHLVARLHFTLIVNGKTHEGLTTDLKQSEGSGHFDDAPIEVSRPDGFRGSFNYAGFRDVAERYYRESFIGAAGSSAPIQISGPIPVYSSGNYVEIDRRYEFSVEDGAPGW